MRKILYLPVLLYSVSLINTKPIVQNKDYEVKRKVINTPDAPAPVAPFNQAIQKNYMLYLTGQIGLDPKTESVLNAARSSIDQLAHCLLMLTNIDDDYELFNLIYSQWHKSSEYFPAPSSMGVAELPFTAKIAIECQANTTKEI